MSWYMTHRVGDHITVERFDGKEVLSTWSQMNERIRGQCAPDEWVVEVFPPEKDLIDEVNKRHFWVVDQQTLHLACPSAIWF